MWFFASKNYFIEIQMERFSPIINFCFQRLFDHIRMQQITW